MKRSFTAIAAATLTAVTLTACKLPPPDRYYDTVFASADKTTEIYTTTVDLVTGQPLPLRTDVYQPAGDTLTTRPAIIWIHGGGFRKNDRSRMERVADAYARRGYVTLSIDYRLDPDVNCHAALQVSPDPEIKARCLRAVQAAEDDAFTALAWLRDHASTYRIDATRIAVGGSSAGAFTAVNVGERGNPDGGPVPAARQVAAVLAMSGCQFDLPSIDAIDAPLSLLASGNDPQVPFDCVTSTADTAQTQGTDVERLYYPEESAHAQALYADHQAATDEAWTAFLVKHLRLS